MLGVLVYKALTKSDAKGLKRSMMKNGMAGGEDVGAFDESSRMYLEISNILRMMVTLQVVLQSRDRFLRVRMGRSFHWDFVAG